MGSIQLDNGSESGMDDPLGIQSLPLADMPLSVYLVNVYDLRVAYYWTMGLRVGWMTLWEINLFRLQSCPSRCTCQIFVSLYG